MNKLMQNKSKNQSNSRSVKKQRPKPQWTTDFVDREQYKLSQVQRIQKKASLQSKNRQQAKRELEQRRKKLQMGIIDEQTRKIYETALTAKNIDINPPLRRNLTEMIKYERQQRQKANEENYNDEQNEEDLDDEEQSMNELKQAQNFIKKFEKAKKQQKIQRAVEILSNNNSMQTQKQTALPQTRMNNFLSNVQPTSGKYKNSAYSQNRSNKSDAFSQDEAISSIEDTIRFMEEKLFMAKKTVDEHSRSFISQANESFDNGQGTGVNFQIQDRETGFSTKYNFKKPQKADKKPINSKFEPPQPILINSQEQLQFNTKLGQISQLRIKIKDSNDTQSDDQCLDTIRRMRQLLDNQQSYDDKYQSKRMKQNIKDNFMVSPIGGIGINSSISKKYMHSGMDSQAEVSFNLTMNEDQFQPELSKMSRNEFMPKMGKNNNQDQKKIINKQKDEYEEEYQNIKQNLFSCINSESQPSTNFTKPNNNHKFPKTQNQKPSISKFQQQSKNFVHGDSDEQDNSEDSLMVKNKINMWKKEFEHQVDPSDEEEQQINFKKPVKAPMRVQQKQQQDEEEEFVPYKHNVFSEQPFSNYDQLESKSSKPQPVQQSITRPPITKKPPLARKTPQDEKFEQMKKMISNASTQIKKLQIEPLKIESLGSSQVIGFDFRGSLNIKKNIK